MSRFRDTFIISEYRHWEESHSYLLNGDTYSLLIDTGLGIENIREQIEKLTNKPVIAVATHVHWDHIGGHRYFPDFYAHAEEVNWLNGEFPLTMEQIKAFVVEDCDLPEGFDVDGYAFFQGMPSRVLEDGDRIDIGGRKIEVLHTPGHSPGHVLLREGQRIPVHGRLGIYRYIIRVFSFHRSCGVSEFAHPDCKLTR